MTVDTIRLSKTAKDQLLTLKRRTGLQQWNILCRWALCRSLAEPSSPPDVAIPTDSNVEMTWKVFAGDYGDLYMALIQARCLDEGRVLSDDVMARQLRLHLHRGIGYLFADPDVKSIDGLVSLAVAD